MAASLGSLVVSLGLDATQYIAGLTKSEYQAKKFAKEVGSGIRKARDVTLALTGATIGAAAAIAKIADGIASYQGIAEKIGDSAVAVAGLQLAADKSGTSLEEIAAISAKLTATLSKTQDQSKGAGAALKAIGINLEEFKRLTPTEQLQAFADGLAKFEDGSGKTAVAVAALGKSGADALGFLQDLGEVGSKNTTLTAQQIEQADKLTKIFGEVKNSIRGLTQSFASEFIPGLSNVIKAMAQAYKDSGILKAAFIGLGGAASVALGLDDTRKASIRIREIADEVERAQTEIAKRSQIAGPNPDDTGPALISPRALKKNQDRIAQLKKSLVDLAAEREKLEKQLVAPAEAAATEPPKPTLDFSQGDTAADLALKRRIALNKAAVDAILSQEKELENQRLSMLDLFNSQGLISTRDYYAQRKNIIELGAEAEVTAINKRLAAERAAASKASKDGEYEKETEALVEIQKLLAQREALQSRVATTFVVDSIKQQEEMKKLADTMRDVNAQILSMTGNSAEAARIRQQSANEDLRKRLTNNGDEAGLRQLDTLEKLTIAQAAFSDESQKQSDIQTRLGLDEERIQNSRRVGAISELEALQRTGAARQAAAKELEVIVKNMEDVARASGNPALVLQAEQARVALESLGAEANLLADKFDTIFKDAAGSALADFVKGTKTAKEAFADFTTSVANSITDLIAQDFATQLMKSIGIGGAGGGGGGMGGIGGFFAGLFGGGGSGAATIPMAGSSGLGLWGDLASLIPGFAVGSDFVPRDTLAFVHRGERIVPASENMGGRGRETNVNMTVVTPDAGSFRASRGQIASSMAATLSASRRNL